MIRGLGVDIIEIGRIKRSIDRFGAHFLDRLFTKKEQAYCTSCKDRAIRFAGRFAAKEAIAKALGTGFGKQLSWLDLEILNDANGKPKVLIEKRVWSQLRLDTKDEVLISLSHCKEYAVAQALWVG